MKNNAIFLRLNSLNALSPSDSAKEVVFSFLPRRHSGSEKQ